MVNSRLASRTSLLAPDDAPPVEWVVTPGLTQYSDALAEMETRAETIARGDAPERVWLIEHPPLYTAGTSAKESDLVEARFPVHRAGRGGQFTYHGPGQRVAYVMLDLKRRQPDVRAYVTSLERWLIEALKAFDVVGATFPGLPGFPHFGFNGSVGWAITHADADNQDLYIERFEGSRYLTLDGWADAVARAEQIEVRGGSALQLTVWQTQHGPVVHGDPRQELVLALKYTATAQPDRGLECIDRKSVV